ncbi:hypothetical protein V7S43_016793 [Phytophthora oleae]|uniref:Uncharacterized protein n=1 Tax=Phytophthora oleae TaxID=2107226 RepID=A0ABD3EUN1_9STRA
MADDGIAAAEIAKQIAALKPRVEGSRGVMGYLDKSKGADVNKMFLASTIRGVNSHNRRQEEDKCWTLRRMERKLDKSTDRRRSRRSRSRDRKPKRRRSSSRSRSRSRNESRRRRSRSREEMRSRRSRSRDCKSPIEKQSEKKEDKDERSYWANKKADKTRKLWGNLHSEGSVSVENAPDFSSEESDDDDVKFPSSKKKHKKQKKHNRRSDKKAKRRSHS